MCYSLWYNAPTMLPASGRQHNSVLNEHYHEKEAYVIAQAGIPEKITIATNMAGRGICIQLGANAKMLAKMELKNPNQDKEVIPKVERDKDIVINVGGLCVIGNERHESRPRYN